MLAEFSDFEVKDIEVSTDMEIESYLKILETTKSELDLKSSNLHLIDRHVSRRCSEDILKIADAYQQIDQLLVNLDINNPGSTKYAAVFTQITIGHLNGKYDSPVFSAHITGDVTKLPLFLHIFGAMVCLFFSTLFHLF